MGFRLENTSEYIGKVGETDWWSWKANIVATEPDSLAEIQYVEYLLHPSFPDPVQRVKLKYGGFPLTMKGWGTFNLKAKLIFEDTSKKDLILRHTLKFVDPPQAPSKN